MVGWMDDEALHRTLTTGRSTYWSRTRQEYWVKGDTSGPHPAGQVGRARLRRRHRAGQGRPGRRGLPHRRPHLLRRRASCARRLSEPTRSRAAEFGELARTHRLVPIARTLFADAETPVGVYRKLAARASGHVPARVGRARPFVLALLVRRRQRGRIAVGRDGEARWTGTVPAGRADQR